MLTESQALDQIPAERKRVIETLAEFVRNKVKADQQVRLTFICTHNSRRSHMAQLWTQAASWYYGIPNVRCFSGGTEATAFNPRAVEALREAGFSIEMATAGENPVYEVKYADEPDLITAF